MLIKLNRGYLRINKNSIPADSIDRLTKYLNEIWVTYSEDSNSIVIKAEPDRLYNILYRISLHFDIELM